MGTGMGGVVGGGEWRLPLPMKDFRGSHIIHGAVGRKGGGDREGLDCTTFRTHRHVDVVLCGCGDLRDDLPCSRIYVIEPVAHGRVNELAADEVPHSPHEKYSRMSNSVLT